VQPSTKSFFFFFLSELRKSHSNVALESQIHSNELNNPKRFFHLCDFEKNDTFLVNQFVLSDSLPYMWHWKVSFILVNPFVQMNLVNELI